MAGADLLNSLPKLLESTTAISRE